MTKTLIPTNEALFPLGNIVVTTNAMAKLSHFEYIPAVVRHAQGDWGNLDPEDARRNDDALEHGDRILSAYGTGSRRFWIITEADRSVTTILLPEDY
jgi:hypothetical protein